MCATAAVTPSLVIPTQLIRRERMLPDRRGARPVAIAIIRNASHLGALPRHATIWSGRIRAASAS